MNRLKLGGLTLLLFFPLAISLLGTFANPPKAYADSGLSSLCIPPTKPFVINGKQTGSEPTGWLALQWIDRATIKLTYTPNGNCTNGNSAQYLAGQKEFASLISGSYTTGFFNNLVYTPCSGNSCPNQSHILKFGNNIYSAMHNDPFGNDDAKVSDADLNNSLQGTEYIIGIPPSKVGVPGVSCDFSSASFELSVKGGDNGPLYWKCQSDNLSSDTGIKVYNTYTNKDAFNTTYRVDGSGVGTTILSVLDKSNNYVWCPGANGGAGQFQHQNCTSADPLIIDGTPDSFAQLGAGVGDALIHNKDSSKKETVSVAGPTSDSAQAAATATGAGDSSTALKCEATGWTLAWLACPIINAVTDASDYIFQNAVAPLLNTPAISVTNTGDSASVSTFKAWATFRDIADILLVIAVIVIVFAQSIGGGVFEAYTIKKVVPRILVAAILINLSIYIVALMVDITNILGSGIYSLLTSPFKDAGFHITLNGGGSAGLGLAVIVAGIFAAAAGKALITFLLLFVVMPVFLAFAAILLTLIVRRGLILLLVIVSPVAFALYCLPNTEKYFRQWWKLLFEALLVYPIVFAVFAISRILPSIISATTSTGGVTSAIGGIVAIIVVIAPLFFIPYSFKLAGGLIGNLHGAFTNYHKKGQEFVKGNANDPNSLRNTARRQVTGNLVKNRAQFVRSNSNRGGLRGFAGRRLNYGNIYDKEAEINEDAQRRLGRTTGVGDDTYVRARTSIPLYRKADGGETANMAEAALDAQGNAMRMTDATGNALRASLNGQKRYTDNDYTKSTQLYRTMGELQEAVNYEAKKTLTDRDTDTFLGKYGDFAEQEGLTTEQAAGIFTGVAFTRQNERLELKHGSVGRGSDGRIRFVPATANLGTKIGRDGQLQSLGGRDAFIQELYDKKGSYLVSQMHDSTINEVSDAKDAYATEIRAMLAGSAGGPLTREQNTRLSESRKQLAQIQQMEDTWVGQEQRVPGQPIPAGEEGSTVQSYPGLSGAAEGVQQAAKRLAYRDTTRPDGSTARIKKKYDQNGQLIDL